MQISDLSSLNAQVLGASFIFSLLFGAIAQRTHFCTMGAISDVVNMGDWQRMRQWALAAGVAMLGFGVLTFLGKIDPGKTLYASSRVAWLSALVGGCLFGFGMVLASGCGSKTLVRVGSGSLKSLIVLIVMGVSAFATLKGITAVARVATVDQISIDSAALSAISLGASSVLGLKIQAAQLLAAGLIGGALLLWAMAPKEFRRSDNLLAGLGIGAIITAMWWVSGSLGYVPEHPDTLQEAFVATNSGRAEALSFVAPVAYTVDWLIFFSDQSKVLSLGIVTVLGVITGSALMALATQRFRWEGFGSTEDVANHLVGAVLMGVGGVTAMGCTVGQGLSGVSTLSVMSFLAVAAIVLGAVMAFKYQTWRLEKTA
jgi:uncharacterized membrane protein YedE/YeeE